MSIRLGTQFTGSLAPRQSRTWFSHSWNANWNVVWACIPIAPVRDGPPQISWDVRVSRQTASWVKWHITARNLVNEPVRFQARYAILNF